MLSLLMLIGDLYVARWNVRWATPQCVRHVEIWRSTDHGSSWSHISDVGHDSDGYFGSDLGLGITANPGTNELWLIVSTSQGPCYNGVEVSRSTDGGLTWQNIADMGISYSDSLYDLSSADIAYDPTSNNLFAYFTYEGTTEGRPYFLEIRRSTDGGFSWEHLDSIQIANPSDTYYKDSEGDLTVSNDGTLWIGDWIDDTGHALCYTSTDGGNSWSLLGSISPVSPGGDARSVSLTYLSPYLYAGVWAEGCTLSVYRSSDDGSTWSRTSIVRPWLARGDGVVSMVAEPSGYLYLTVFDPGHYSPIFRSSDGGITWDSLCNLPFDSTYFLQASSMDMTTTTPALFNKEDRGGSSGLAKMHAEEEYVSLYLPRKTEITLCLYDASGRLAQVLYKGLLPAGEHTFALRIKAKGVYFAVLRTHEEIKTLKITR